MVIFMSGYPAAGKTTVVRAVLAALPFDVVVIDPKHLRTDGYEQMDEATKTELNLSVWQVSQEVLAEQISSTKDNVIIFYDTACANLPKMRPLFEQAKAAGHHVIYCFVIAPLEECGKRSGDKWLSEQVIDKYVRNFKENINVFKVLADKMLVVRNETNDAPDVGAVVDYITKYYG